ncbi:MAG: Dabb family protein [Kiritimatiellales bacterium]
MVKHIVLWTMKPEAVPEKKLEAKNRLEALVGMIPGLHTLEVGIDAGNGTMSLYSELDSFDALAGYQEHPAHKTAGALIQELAAARCVSDYET